MDRPLIVTTTKRTTPLHIERAELVARRCGTHYTPKRGSFAQMWERHHAGLLYIVGRERERIADPTQHLFVNPGMFFARLESARNNPLLTAITNGVTPASLLDLTTGLGQELLFLSSAFPDTQIEGCEASPIVFSLLEEGFARMQREEAAWSEAASRVTIHLTEALTHLRGLPDQHIDVIYMDPMFTVPQAAPPGYHLLRCAAHHQQAGEDLLEEALRVARRHVVLKTPLTSTPPPLCEGRDFTPIVSRRLAFWRIKCPSQ